MANAERSSVGRQRAVVAVHLLFLRGGQVLLLRRANTGYEDGNYSVPAGHVEAGESPSEAGRREALEEVGVCIATLRPALVMHRLTEERRIDFFFAVDSWTGSIENREPAKCDELLWSAIDDLPANTIRYVAAALQCFRGGETYAEFM